MALVLNLTTLNRYTDGIHIDIADASTGWGDAKDGGGTYPLRSEVGIHLFGWEMDYNSNRVQAITISNTGAGTVTQWPLAFSQDCWFQVNMLAITLWSAGTYAAGAVVSHNGKIYLTDVQTTDVPGGAGSDWDEVTDHESLIDDDENVVKTEYSSDVYFLRWNSLFAVNADKRTVAGMDVLDIYHKDYTQSDDVFKLVKQMTFLLAAEWNSLRGDNFKADLIVKRHADL